MSTLDWLILCGTLAVIVGYGVTKTRGRQDLSGYLRGGDHRWLAVGLSVMATQASAVTFLSLPGQAFDDGMRFIQLYFGLPLAMVVLSVLFVPRYFAARVFTAYQFLENRFDLKTRQLTAFLFLLQRGLSAGITIYAPAIVLSSQLGWPLRSTCLAIGSVVILYTVMGGNRAVVRTQKQQMLVMLAGLLVALIVILVRLSPQLSLAHALQVAGTLGKLNLVDVSTDLGARYTLWSGLIGGFFLALAYFGTDQSQVQRYLSARSVAECRTGLLCNGLLKLPMQLIVLFVGVMVFVFYQLHPPPLFFNRAELAQAESAGAGSALAALQTEHDLAFVRRRAQIERLDKALTAGDTATIAAARQELRRAHREVTAIREKARSAIAKAVPRANPKDADYVFLAFVTQNLPRGVVGLLLAVILCAAMSAVAGELSALSSTTLIDFYQRSVRPHASDAHYVWAARLFTVVWGALALAFAILAALLDNLIQAVNILGSLFYGTVLGIFVTGFLLRRVQGTAVFVAAIISELLVLALFKWSQVSFLWFNLVGCLAVAAIATALTALRATRPARAKQEPSGN